MLAKLLSRKLWMAVAGFATSVANHRYDLAVYVVLGYLGVEGAADVKSRM